ncbi:MAG: peptidoglycan DD-metalloendopeptidase family protein [Desulfuromonadales bacterium]|nr:peptidoglycan DD-metalloendopeptidase family protein [Desulfuromonadales bacterium]
MMALLLHLVRPGVLAVLLGLALLITPAGAVDDDLASSRRRLTALQGEIEAMLAKREAKQGEAVEVGRKLASLQREIGRVRQRVQRSEQQLAENEQAIVRTQRRIDELETTLQQSRRRVERRLVVLYKTGEVGPLSLLFAAEVTPAILAEKYTFLTRMVRHDRQLIADYRVQVETQRQEVAALQALRTQQQETVNRLRQEQQLLTAAEAADRRLSARLRQDRELLDQTLADLRARAASLNELVKRLESEQHASYTDSLAGLSAVKGKLPWPVDGLILTGYGTRRDSELGSLIDSKGLELAAKPGSSVRVIAPGKVLFAKPLRGYGQLLIVDHGNKDYSLYAHLARFARKEGDRVTAGDAIGLSGFEGRDSIYFEIRHGGEPLNPLDWLKPR